MTEQFTSSPMFVAPLCAGTTELSVYGHSGMHSKAWALSTQICRVQLA